jgi:predicted nucleotidyltransferase
MNLKSYASYFVSYFLNNLKSIEHIEKIILFGSVAKGEAGKESDVDIFVEIRKESKKFKKEAENILSEFYKSREALIFKNKGIDNKINLIMGELSKWKDLKRSIEATGIVLYGKYFPADVKGKKYAAIFWEKIGKNRGALLNKIYGFKIKGKEYAGLLDKFEGRKLGKSCIMIPIEYRDNIVRLLKKYKANARIIELYWEE